jgi:RHS repeat-associated protein/uncharacterized repeat protein (TIGR01451 family)
LEEQSGGDILIHWPGSFIRMFKSNDSGTYTALPGDHGTLVRDGDTFELTEKDGTIYRFRADRRLDYVEDTNGNRITAIYDGNGRLIRVRHSNGDSFALEYNANGRISRLTDQVGRATEYSYDATGEHLSAVTAPGDRLITYTYSISSGQPINHALLSVSYPNGTHQYYAYDSLGQLSEESLDGGAEHVGYTYDVSGRVYVTDAQGHTAIISPDEHGRPANVRDALGRNLRQEYDSNFNVSRLTGPTGQSYQFNYDLLGNVIAARDPLGHQVTLGYDTRFSQVAVVKDERGNRSTFDYDGSGNLTAMTYPDGSGETIAYDSSGNPITYTTRSGDVITLTHNARGQLLRKGYPDGSWVAYTYDATGNMTSASNPSGTITMTFDSDTDLMTRIVYPSGHYFEFRYNAAGQRTQRRDQDGHELNYEYDAAGRLSRLYDEDGNTLVSYEYDDNGLLHRESKGNGTYTTYEYDAAGQLVHMVNYAPGGSVQSRFDYTYDANGNRTTMTTLEGTTIYEYDAISQLVGVTYPTGRRVAYAYDAAGNRIAVTDDETRTAYSTNDLNQYARVGDATYTYDTNGNMTSETNAGGTTTYEYDAENRLIRVTTPMSGTWEYAYDALGNRVAVEHDGVVTRYVYDPIGLVDVAAEYDGNGALVAQYVHGLGLVSRIDASGQPAYYAYDATGNTRQVTNDAGTVANTYNYDPFGISLQTDETIPNPFRYVGRFGVFGDGSELYYMRMRYYLSSVGQFVSDDPLAVAGGDANIRRYVWNNPLTWTDPLGLGYFWERPLENLPGMIPSHIGDALNIELLHEQYIFDNGENYGYGPEGRFSDKDLSGYVRSSSYYDDVIMRHALFLLEMEEKQRPFALFPLFTVKTYNCQSWAERLREIYDGIKPIYEPPPDGGGGDGDSHCPPIIRPSDPNEKVGPPGLGEQHLVSAGDELGYTIYFENVVTATAPAQEVFVADYLDPNLDWSTFRVTEVAFGDRLIAAQEQGQFYTQESIQDYREETNKSWWVDVTAMLDYQTGRVLWTFRTLDPETGELPEDPLAGFLPPNDATGRGEGHVSFSIRPRAGITLGTRITNTASIVFDVNEPIQTNEWWNTVGAVADLVLTKTANLDPVAVGNALTYTLAITNYGPDAATGVVVTDTLPVSATLASAFASQGSCSGTYTVTCNLGMIQSGVSVTATLVVTVTAAGIIENTANVDSSVIDNDTINNSASITTTATHAASADLNLTKTDSPDPIAVGDRLTYTIAVINHGPDAATGVVVTDTLPVSVTLASASASQGSCGGTSTVICNLGMLNSGVSVTATLVVTVTAAGRIANTAQVASDILDGNAANNSATTVTTATSGGYTVFLPLVLRNRSGSVGSSRYPSLMPGIH